MDLLNWKLDKGAPLDRLERDIHVIIRKAAILEEGDAFKYSTDVKKICQICTSFSSFEGKGKELDKVKADIVQKSFSQLEEAKIAVVSKAVSGRVPELVDHYKEKTTEISQNRLLSFDWKVNLALSSSQFSELNEPQVLVNFMVENSTQDKESFMVEFSSEELDSLLQEMENIENVISKVSL